MNETQSAHTHTKMTEMLQLSEKDLKVVTVKMLHQAITNMLETNEKSLRKETEEIKKKSYN